MTIDVWSDVICPYCAIGHAHLERALERFEHSSEVVLAHRAFELDPRAPLSYDRSLDELVARKYSLEINQAGRAHARLESEALRLGLEWNLGVARPGNTFDAHRLLVLAADQGRGQALLQRLFRAYFTEGALLSDRATLENLATDVGVAGCSEWLSGEAGSSEVRSDESDALELGLSGVPAFLIDGRFLVLGAQPIDHIVQTLERAWARRQVASPDS